MAQVPFNIDVDKWYNNSEKAMDWVTNWDEAQTADTLDKVYGGLYKDRGRQMGL